MTRVLVFQPNALICDQIKTLLEKNILWAVDTSNQKEAEELLQKQFFHLCIWHVENEHDLHRLTGLKQKKIETQFIVVSKNATPAFIVKAMQAGAAHFWAVEENLESFQVALKETLTKVATSRSGDGEGITFKGDFIGKHPLMVQVFEIVESVKDSDANVLILGESGTGKEVVARAVHELGKRAKRPFTAVNCSAIPGNLLESELFGHVKGAFTGAIQTRLGRFQIAKEGTLFLDEISEMPLDLQAKLLRAIQQRIFEPVGSAQSAKLEARVIAATNQDLEKLVSEKRFREDLFYRLNVIPIRIPPLRARKTDIPLLVKNFLEKFNQANNKPMAGISEEAMKCLTQYHWPGNVRELENLIERVIVLKKDCAKIEIKDFPVDYFSNVRIDRFVANINLPEEGLNFNEAVDEFENELILQALHKTAGNKNQAASLLKLNRTTLIEKLKRKNLRIQTI